VPALHALQDQIVPGLQREMQMRHQAAFRRDDLAQDIVDLDRVDRGQSQARQLGHFAQDRPHELPQARRVQEIAAIACQVDAGQDDLARAGLGQAAALRDHLVQGERA
jgi:hypothetical protein